MASSAKRLWVTSLVLWAGCGDSGGPSGGSPDQITITSQDPAVGITGRYLGTPFTLGLVAGSPEHRTASFGAGSDGGVADGGATTASIITDDVANSATFQVGAITWTNKASLSADDRTALQQFTKTSAGAALVNTAGYLYFKQPDFEYTPYRVAAIQLYRELAEFYDDANKRLTQPAGSALAGCTDNPCQVRSNDAIFGCSYPTGDRYDVVIMLGGLPAACQVTAADVARSHERNACYGACGLSCGGHWQPRPVAQGGCKLVTFRCSESNVPEPSPPTQGTSDVTSKPVGCFDSHAVPFYPAWDLRLNQSACMTPMSYPAPAAGGDASYWLCSSLTACYQHDECLRHDTFGSVNYAICNVRGERGAGLSAMWGKPHDPQDGHWDYKWFDAAELPLTVGASPVPNPPDLGTCNWTVTCGLTSCSIAAAAAPPGQSVPMPLADLEQDHQKCLVHGCKHMAGESFCRCTTDAECVAFQGGESPPEKACQGGRCVCKPKTCMELGLDCGDQPDGCGNTVHCGTPCTSFTGTEVWTYETPICTSYSNPTPGVPAAPRSSTLTLTATSGEAIWSFAQTDASPKQRYKFMIGLGVTTSLSGPATAISVAGGAWQTQDLGLMLNASISPSGRLTGTVENTNMPAGCQHYDLDMRKDLNR